VSRESAGAEERDALVRRTKDGWRVAGTEVGDLTSAMVLADLLASELPAELPQAGPPVPASGPAAEVSAQPVRAAHAQAASDGSAAEVGRLRATIGQLEHALAARVRVEQAIGVLAERYRIAPRQAFDRIRQAARARGKRVIDIASDVVASATNPLLQLPDELTSPRSPSRQSRQRLLGTD
jgi:hypothetical protein